MNEQEKIEILADILEVEEEEIQKNKFLTDFDAWDSVAVLSVISVMNENFNKFPHADEIKSYETIGDLMEAMN